MMLVHNISVELIFFFVHSVITAAIAITINLIPAYQENVEGKGLSSALVLSILFCISVFVTLLMPTIASFVWQYRQKKQLAKLHGNNNSANKEKNVSADSGGKNHSHDDDDDDNNEFMAALLDVLHEDSHTRKRHATHQFSSAGSSGGGPSAAAAAAAMIGLKRKFKTFCQKEFAQESLLCWDDIEKYKSISSPEKRIQMAKEIQKTYIDAKAPLPLNIDSNLQREVEEGINTGDEHLFDNVQKHLQEVMFDTFFRFMQTKQYKEALENRALQMKLLESSGVV